MTIGYGESKPLNENKNKQERRINRRVEFKFVK
jgi:outer membrane protein OmpA-like peptidoglycan-associated protein